MLKPVYDYLDWNAPNAYAKGWTKPVLVPPPLDPQARVVPEPPGADMEINNPTMNGGVCCFGKVIFGGYIPF
ncbi:MAG: hypothetical protein FWD88_02000 [Treponema sp.]|nr:hypothetical protein [Treponema sp.]